MPTVNSENPSKLDTIHIRRILHAFYLLTHQLRLVGDDCVDQILDNFSITHLPGKSVGIEYSFNSPQILENELKLEHGRIALEAKKSHKKKVSKSRRMK